MSLTLRIKQLRKAKGWTQTELSDAVRALPGVDSNAFTQQTISKIESGSVSGKAWIFYIADVCGADVHWLTYGGSDGGSDAAPVTSMIPTATLKDWIKLLRTLSRQYETMAGGLTLPDEFHDEILECGLLLSVGRALPVSDKDKQAFLNDIIQQQRTLLS